MAVLERQVHADEPLDEGERALTIVADADADADADAARRAATLAAHWVAALPAQRPL